MPMSLPIIITIVVIVLIVLGIGLYYFYKYVRGETIYSFDGSGSLSGTWTKPYGKDLKIKFDILTPAASSVGPIMFIGSLGTKPPMYGVDCTATLELPCDTYSYLLLNGTAIDFVYGAKTGGILKLSTTAAVPMNDNKWHSVVINRAGDVWTLSVDGTQLATQTKAFTEVIPSSTIYVGTTPTGVTIAGASPLKACIRNLTIDGTVVTGLTPSAASAVAYACKYLPKPKTFY